MPFEHDGDGLFLYGRGLGVTLCDHAGENTRVQGELFEFQLERSLAALSLARCRVTLFRLQSKPTFHCSSYMLGHD